MVLTLVKSPFASVIFVAEITLAVLPADIMETRAVSAVVIVAELLTETLLISRPAALLSLIVAEFVLVMTRLVN